MQLVADEVHEAMRCMRLSPCRSTVITPCANPSLPVHAKQEPMGSHGGVADGTVSEEGVGGVTLVVDEESHSVGSKALLTCQSTKARGARVAPAKWTQCTVTHYLFGTR